jgi:hypothetical protein
MIPAGYMFKKVVSRPAWLKDADVDDIFSLSVCVSENFTDYISYWKHNGLAVRCACGDGEDRGGE